MLWCGTENDTSLSAPSGSAQQIITTQHRAATPWTAEQIVLFADKAIVGADIFKGDIAVMRAQEFKEKIITDMEEWPSINTPNKTCALIEVPIPKIVYACYGLVANGRHGNVSELRGLLNLSVTLERKGHPEESKLLYDAGFIYKYSAALIIAFAMVERIDMLEMIWRAFQSTLQNDVTYILCCCYARKLQTAIQWFKHHVSEESHICAAISTNFAGSVEYCIPYIAKYASARTAFLTSPFVHYQQYAIKTLRPFSSTDICCLIQGMSTNYNPDESPQSARPLTYFLNAISDLHEMNNSQWFKFAFTAIQYGVNEVAAYCIQQLAPLLGKQRDQVHTKLEKLFRNAVQHCCVAVKILESLGKLYLASNQHDAYETTLSKAHEFTLHMSWANTTRVSMNWQYMWVNAINNMLILSGKHKQWIQMRCADFQALCAAIGSNLTSEALQKQSNALEVS